MWRSLPYWKQFPDPARSRARIPPHRSHRAGDRERGGRFCGGTAGFGGHAGEAGSCCGCDPARPGFVRQGYDSVTAGSSGGSDVNADLHHPGHCIAPAIDRDSIAPRYVSRDLCNHNFSAGCLSNSSISPGHEESNS